MKVSLNELIETADKRYQDSQYPKVSTSVRLTKSTNDKLMEILEHLNCSKQNLLEAIINDGIHAVEEKLKV